MLIIHLRVLKIFFKIIEEKRVKQWSEINLDKIETQTLLQKYTNKNQLKNINGSDHATFLAPQCIPCVTWICFTCESDF